MSGEIDHLLKLKSVIINKNDKEQLYQIEESAPANIPSAVLMRFNGIETPEDAKTLNGGELLVEREQAAPLNDGEFYIEDLKGLLVMTVDGQSIGQITDIIEGGGTELAEIKLLNGEKRLVPFRDEFITGVCLEKKQVVLQNLWILE
jgi:16S rRNA processing protein RimM